MFRRVRRPCGDDHRRLKGEQYYLGLPSISSGRGLHNFMVDTPILLALVEKYFALRRYQGSNLGFGNLVSESQVITTTL